MGRPAVEPAEFYEKCFQIGGMDKKVIMVGKHDPCIYPVAYGRKQLQQLLFKIEQSTGRITDVRSVFVTSRRDEIMLSIV